MYQMMGDPGTSDTMLPHPTSGIPRRHEFQGQAPSSALDPSVPSFSNSLHRQPLPFFQPLHRPAESFRQDGCEEWSSRDSQPGAGPPSGLRDCAEDQVPGLLCHSEGTRDVMTRARVGEDDLFTFPEGEHDAVTMTARDLASLQPGKFVTDNTIDFYIKYLKEKSVSPENQNQFHFFNSFFFTKLLEKSSSTGVDECKVDYEQLRMWTADVNLFEKDYVFIPIIESSHWSLIVLCHLKSLHPSSHVERKGPPCILHLDPIEGKHEHFEGQVRSYVLQAWAERMRASEYMDILHSLVQMKYVQAKVPQQDNNYDCGLYVLHYIEVFLSKSTSQNLSFSSRKGGANFTRQNFKMEVFHKRNYIQGLMFKLSGMVQVQDGNLFDTQPKHQDKVGLVHSRRRQHQGSPKCAKETKSKKWKEIETSILLQCMVDGGHFCNGKLGAMHWDPIAEAINLKSNGGPSRSKEQCQNRFDTLLKAYKDLNAYCEQTGKKFSEVADDEKRGLKLATPLEKKNEGWYNNLHTIYCWRSSLRCKGRKRQKLNPNGDIDACGLASSRLNSSQDCLKPLDLIGSLESSRMVQVHDGNLFDTQPKHQDKVELVHSPRHQHQGSPKRAKETKSKKWKEIETLILLQCMVDGGHFCNGKLGAMHWDPIAEAINLKSNGGPFRSKEQCQNRFDTLLKAYKDLNAYCEQTSKKFSEVTDDEKRGLKLATPLEKKNEGWYNNLHTICCGLCKSGKLQKLNLDGENSKLTSSPLKSAGECSAPLNLIGSSESKKTSSRAAAFVKAQDHQLPSLTRMPSLAWIPEYRSHNTSTDKVPSFEPRDINSGFVPPLMESGRDLQTNLDLQPSTSYGSDVVRETVGNFPANNLWLRNHFPRPNLDFKDLTCAGFEVTPAGTSFPTSDDNGWNKHRWSDARTNPTMRIPSNNKPQTPPRSSCKPGVSQYHGVRFRPDLQKWVAQIRVAEWKAVDKKVWLGTFDTEQAAARAVDLARKLVKCRKRYPLNLPCEKLEAYSRQIPPRLILTDLTDTSMFKQVTLFIKRECQEYAASFDDTPSEQIIPAFDQQDSFGGQFFNPTSSVNPAAPGYENMPPPNSSDVLNTDVHSESVFQDMILDLTDLTCAGFEVTPAGTSFPTSDDNGWNKHRWSDARTNPTMRIPSNNKPQTPPRSSCKPGVSQYHGVRFRPDLQKWVAQIRVAEWKAVDKKVWLGTFDTEQAAARAVDLARKLVKCRKRYPLNLPCEKLEAYSRQIPPRLILTDLTDTSMFKQVTLFIKRECQEYAASFDDTPSEQIIPAFDQQDSFGGQFFNPTSSVNPAAPGYENMPPPNSSDVLNTDVHSESVFQDMILDLTDLTCAGFEVTPAGTGFPTSDDNGWNKHRWSDARTNPTMRIPSNNKPQTPPRSSCKPGVSQYHGVRFRPDLQKWVAQIRVAEWKAVDKKVWLGTFDTEQAAARAVDLARKLVKCRKRYPLNLPCEKLEAYSRQIPPRLILTDLTDTSMFKQVTLFIKRECQEYAASFDDTPSEQIIPAFDQQDSFGGQFFNPTSSVNPAAPGYENMPPPRSSDALTWVFIRSRTFQT